MRHDKSGTKTMQKTADGSLKIAACNPPSLVTSAKPHLRYAGFEATETGRCLWFSVSGAGRGATRITVQVSDAQFMAAPGISIQDAAPMAYEKILDLLAMQDLIDSSELCLTDADITQYIYGHRNSPKRAFFSTSDRKQFDTAA